MALGTPTLAWFCAAKWPVFTPPLTVFHIKLRQEFKARGASVECLNFRFEDTPEGTFVETIMAAQGELEREQNRRQTIQKMKARVEKGYYVWNTPPRGLRYEARRDEGKVLVRDEPVASILTEALEGFANGRFETQVEVKRFLEAQPLYPKDLPDGTIRNQRIPELLSNTTYAGYVEAPSWGVSLRKGQHDGLITFQTFGRIQERLRGGAKAPARKDISADFPLRGFILCDDCDKPLTACWSTSKTGQKHPYYMCKTKGCESYRKSIRRDQLHGDFEDVLQSVQPRRGLFQIAKAMFADAWNQRLSQSGDTRATVKREIAKIEKDVEGLLDRIVEASNATVIAAYEKRISDYERQKILAEEKLAQIGRPQKAFEESFELACRFLASPCNIWESGSLEVRRTVLRLVFLKPLAYSRKQGVGTPEISFPFRALGSFSVGHWEMARWGGFEPPTP